MIPNIPSFSPLFEFLLPRNISGTDFGTGYGGTVCGFHTRPIYNDKYKGLKSAASIPTNDLVFYLSFFTS